MKDDSDKHSCKSWLGRMIVRGREVLLFHLLSKTWQIDGSHNIFQVVGNQSIHTFKILRIDFKMFTIFVKKFFSFTITVMASELVLSNSQTTKETEIVLVSFCGIFIFLQTNNKAVVLNVVREFQRVFKWVCSHDDEYED